MMVVIVEGVEVGKNNIMYLHSELDSLGINCKKLNELNDKEELEFLAVAIKEVYYQDYKTAYDHSHDHKEADYPDKHLIKL
jgi:hypothetical protein